MLAQGLDAVGGGAARGIGGVAEQFGDLGERQAGDVVIGHGLALFGGQALQCRPQVGVAGRGIGAGGGAVGQRVGGDGAAGSWRGRRRGRGGGRW